MRDEASRPDPVQPEDGFRSIANPVFAALQRAGMSGAQFRCALALIDATWGFRRSEARMGLGDFVLATGLAQRTAAEAVTALRGEGVFAILEPAAGRRAPLLRVCKHPWRWGSFGSVPPGMEAAAALDGAGAGCARCTAKPAEGRSQTGGAGGALPAENRRQSLRKTAGKRPPTSSIPLGIDPKPRKKRERKGAAVSTKTKADTSAEEREVFDHWARVAGEKAKGCRFTETRRKKIRARLADGFSVAELCTVIDAVHRRPFYLGENDRRTYYGTPESIFRNTERVEGHLRWAEENPQENEGERDPADLPVIL